MTRTPFSQSETSLNGNNPSSDEQQTPLLKMANNEMANNEMANNEMANSDDWSASTQTMLDTLPRVWIRGLLYVLTGFACVSLTWAMSAQVDKTGEARGRLEPSGKTIRIDSPVNGTVAAVEVKPGDVVQRGQTLLVFDSQLSQTELQQAQVRLEGQLERQNQLVLMRNQLQAAAYTQQLQSQAEYSEQSAQFNQTQQQIVSSQAAYDLGRSRLTLAQRQQQRYYALWEAGALSVSQLDEAEAEKLESQRLLEETEANIRQSQIELNKQQSAGFRIARSGELSVLEAQRQIEEIQSQLISTQTEIAQSEQQIEALKFQLQQRVLKSPQAGTIFQLAVDNASSVLQNGQMVAQLAPEDSPLILRAQMPSSESGFLKIGMPVKVKFDAYRFQEYGIVEGRLRWISPDSKAMENEPNQEFFELEIELAQPHIQANNEKIMLAPGQTATADIIIEQQRMIDILLDPFKRIGTGGLEL